MSTFRRQYGVADIIDGVVLITRGAVDFKSNPTLASGDVTISKDGGAFANLTTLPAVTPASGTSVRVSVSAAELQCKRAVIRFIDQTATKEWEDQEIIIETEGSPDAQHPGDVVYFGTLAAYAAGPPTTADLPSGASTSDNFYNGGVLDAIGGTGAGQQSYISDYVGSTTRRLTLERAPAVAYDATTVVRILKGPLAPTASEQADAVLTAATANPIAANVKEVNDVALQGAGVSGNSMRPA